MLWESLIELNIDWILAPVSETAYSKEQWNLFCHHSYCYTTQSWKHLLLLLLPEQLARVHWLDFNRSVNYTN